MKPNKHQIKSQKTRKVILDAAEPLFAPHGKWGVSMRGIAREAGVDLSLLSYHFESKDKLFNSVVDQIMTDFASRRQKALDELQSAVPNPSLLDLFDIQIDAWLDLAFVYPTHRAQLIFTRFHNPEYTDRAFWPSDTFANNLLAAIEKALPEKDPEFIHWTYHSVMGALIYTLSNKDRLQRISGMHCHTESRDWLRKMFRKHVEMAFGIAPSA
jgi:AcrR family transcriptional regulator